MNVTIHLRSNGVVNIEELEFIRVFMKEDHDHAGNPKVDAGKDLENFYYRYADQYNFVGSKRTVIVSADDIHYLEIIV